MMYLALSSILSFPQVGAFQMCLDYNAQNVEGSSSSHFMCHFGYYYLIIYLIKIFIWLSILKLSLSHCHNIKTVSFKKRKAKAKNKKQKINLYYNQI